MAPSTAAATATTALAVGAAAGLALVLARLLRRPAGRQQDEEALSALLAAYREQLIPGADRLGRLNDDFRLQIAEGLVTDPPVDGKRMLMLPTYVTRMPDGTEQGGCYALDLGGTNFRVMRVRLGDGKGHVHTCEVDEVSLPKEVYTGSGNDLFDFLATTLKRFIDRHEPPSDDAAGAAPGEAPPRPPASLPVLGFCFSFAIKQTALDSGVLLDWTKGFTCSGVVGHDPVALLSQALQRVGRPCRVAALLNDTVGVLAAQRYLDSDTQVGVIIGTGTNACYVEKLGYLAKWTPPCTAPAAANPAASSPSTSSSGRGWTAESATAINMEWGAFSSLHLPLCPEDAALDAASANPGKYLFEKLLSGMFLGEAARRILATVAQQLPGLFACGRNGGGGSGVAAGLTTSGSLTSATLSAVVEDRSLGLRTTRQLLQRELGVAHPSLQAARAARDVCTMVAQRSAELVAMALLAILEHTGWSREAVPSRVTVAFDGGVYERFGAYRRMLDEALRRQLGPRAERLMPHLRLVLTHDGSCFGAAVLAAAAVHGQ